MRRGTESAPLASLSKGAIYFFKLAITINECFTIVKILLDPLPQFTV